MQAMNEVAGVAWAQQELGNIALKQGEFETARRLLEQSLGTFRERHRKLGVVRALTAFARLMLPSQPQRAATLLGAGEAQRQAIGVPLPPSEREEHDRDRAALREILGETGFAAAWATGQSMTEQEAIAWALGEEMRSASDS
jgi:non-specific serine/threonine protein kinase